jgi:hypothetical protein
MNANAITARVVPTHQRPGFLPEFFTPRLMMQAERMIYTQAAQLSPDYAGGLWTFYRLSNGGFYVAPETDQRFALEVTSNGHEGETSADAFGVIVTMFVLGALVWIDNEALREKFTDHYYQLREFAKDHTEAAQIFGAID